MKGKRELTRLEFKERVNNDTAAILHKDRTPQFLRTEYCRAKQKHLPVFAPPAKLLTARSAKAQASKAIREKFKVVKALSETEIMARHKEAAEWEKQIHFHANLRRQGD